MNPTEKLALQEITSKKSRKELERFLYEREIYLEENKNKDLIFFYVGILLGITLGMAIGLIYFT